ncbi:MAG TPA: hypothetical protein DEA05_14930 [Rhodobacteraceae bacterium]|nr:hypothetical protein [Paracoccaceae bacterium]
MTGRALLEDEKVEVTAVEIRHEADLLFKGQSHVLRVALDGERFCNRPSGMPSNAPSRPGSISSFPAWCRF